MVKEYGYEYDAVLDSVLWRDAEGKVARETLWGALCLRSGRDALKVIAREYKSSVVLMPALSCDSMILPFEMYNHKIVYYKLTKDYEIDLIFLQSLLTKIEENVLFLYMDYFGCPGITDDDLNLLYSKYPNMIFIEDRTHNFLYKNERSFRSHYTVVSLRKWINIPDGGLLWTNRDIKNKSFLEDSLFYRKRLSAQCMRHEYFKTGNEELKKEYRKIFSTVSDIIDDDKQPSLMSEYSYRIARAADWEKIRKCRKKNAKQLIKILSDASIEMIQPEYGKSDLYVPMKVLKRDSVQRDLATLGIFTTIIWPSTDEKKSLCSVTRHTIENMLAVPCDQRYDSNDMEFIGKKIVEILNA